MVEKKRKNPWHKRKVNKAYKELCDKMSKHPDVMSKLKHMNDVTLKLSEKTKEVSSIKDEYNNIVGQKTGDLINLLSLETLFDSCTMERDGYLSKVTFKDIIKAGELRKKGMDIAEKNMSLVTDSKLSQIDLILAQIKALLGEEK